MITNHQVDGMGSPYRGSSMGLGFIIVWDTGYGEPSGARLGDILEALEDRARFLGENYKQRYGGDSSRRDEIVARLAELRKFVGGS